MKRTTGKVHYVNLLTSRHSFLVAPIIGVPGALALLIVWANLEPKTCIAFFDAEGCSPFELMTLPLFALIIPLSWLCCPVGGGRWRRVGWSSLYSLLGVMALVREQDWHKAVFARIWPDIAMNFKGTVFKMRFLRDGDIPFAPKLFVVAFFLVFFAAVLIPLVRYFVPLFRDFRKLRPVAWTMACFGLSGVIVLVCDRLPSKLHKAGVVLSDSTSALFTAFEEGGEMMLAIFALLGILQSHLLFGMNEVLPSGAEGE